MGIGDAVERGAEAAGFLRRAGVTGLFWGVVILFVSGATMFVVDRVAMSDRWTRTDHVQYEEDKTKREAEYREQMTRETAAWRARVEAELKVLGGQVNANTTSVAVLNRGLEAILKSLEDLKQAVRQR